MADEITTSWDGLQGLLNDFRQLPAAIQTRIMKGAVATAASVIRKEAILLAPEYTGDVAAGHPPPGTLKSAIYQARLMADCTPVDEVWLVSVRSGKSFQSVGKKGVNRDAYYARWVEYGHYTRVPKSMTKSAKAAGRALGVATWVPAQPFMRPAFDSKKQAAFEAMRDYVQTNLPAAVQTMQVLRMAA